MAIEKIIQSYLEQPLPLWENEITQLLVEHKWEKLRVESNITPSTYTIAGCVINDKSTSQSDFLPSVTNTDIKIEIPSNDLNEFYKKHGLEPVALTEFKTSKEPEKIESAMAIFEHIEPIHNFILNIVNSVQLIKAECEDTDISYSHPDVPFSIFFSVCDEVSLISDLRVAESILHEAMHLKLTLIENVVPLVVPDAKGVYFSPWRDEPRPARGVLHGLFVFKALLDFFEIIVQTNITEIEYIESRINKIKEDLSYLKDFSLCNDLTIYGANLSKSLLPLS